LLVIGVLIFGGFLFLGTIFSAGIALIVVIIKGLGVALGAFFKFAFRSLYSFAFVTGLFYVVYRAYKYFKEDPVERVEYSDKDFDQDKDQYYDWS